MNSQGYKKTLIFYFRFQKSVKNDFVKEKHTSITTPPKPVPTELPASSFQLLFRKLFFALQGSIESQQWHMGGTTTWSSCEFGEPEEIMAGQPTPP